MKMSKIDILAVAAHPDDVELSCSGTLIKHVKAGKKCVVADLTRGELGTRGTPELRMKEAAEASKIMGLTGRVNLGLEDGFFEVNRSSIIELVKVIRLYRPEVLLCNAPRDRHPDHGRGAELAVKAVFYAGLRKLKTEYDGASQEPHRLRAVYHYIQDMYLKPDFVVDISDEWQDKMKSIEAYSSQFYTSKKGSGSDREPETPISSKKFIDFLEGRASQFGRVINAGYAEGFIAVRPPGVKDITDLE